MLKGDWQRGWGFETLSGDLVQLGESAEARPSPAEEDDVFPNWAIKKAEAGRTAPHSKQRCAISRHCSICPLVARQEGDRC